MKPVSRTTLRRRLREARRAIAPATARDHARAVARHVFTSRLVLRAQRFALYTPSDGELDPSEMIDRLLDRGRTVVLPVVLPERQLGFYRYTTQIKLVRNRYGILEPDSRSAAFVATRALDVVFLPLVGFDGAGHRLGMGGGYYDATFGRLRRRPLLVGLAHELQRLDHLDHAQWDIPLDAVVTERGVTTFTRRARIALPNP